MPGKKEAYASERGLQAALAETAFDEIERVEVEAIVGQVRSLNADIHRLEAEIGEQGPQLNGHDNLTSIKGIGTKAAMILLSVIGDINDFADENKLASYFGVVPTIKQSNEMVHLGRISKAGSKLGRTTMVQCTLVAKKYSPYLKQ